MEIVGWNRFGIEHELIIMRALVNSGTMQCLQTPVKLWAGSAVLLKPLTDASSHLHFLTKL